jgi:hypothetical protein
MEDETRMVTNLIYGIGGVIAGAILGSLVTWICVHTAPPAGVLPPVQRMCQHGFYKAYCPICQDNAGVLDG